MPLGVSRGLFHLLIYFQYTYWKKIHMYVDLSNLNPCCSRVNHTNHHQGECTYSHTQQQSAYSFKGLSGKKQCSKRIWRRWHSKARGRVPRRPSALMLKLCNYLLWLVPVLSVTQNHLQEMLLLRLTVFSLPLFWNTPCLQIAK